MEDLDSDVLPLGRRQDVQGHDREVERPLGDVAGLEPSLSRLIEERVQVGFFAGDGAGRVHHVQGGVNLMKNKPVLITHFLLFHYTFPIISLHISNIAYCQELHIANITFNFKTSKLQQ